MSLVEKYWMVTSKISVIALLMITGIYFGKFVCPYIKKKKGAVAVSIVYITIMLVLYMIPPQIDNFSACHEVYETTGYDARNATYRNGTFIAEDGTDLLALFKEKAKNGAGYELYSNRWLEYAKNGWKKENDLVLKIGFDSSGLYDIGQERGYGATQNMWMKGISQSIFEASV